MDKKEKVIAGKPPADVETPAVEQDEEKELVVTKPQDYFKQNVNTRLLELPSGFVVKVRNITLLNLVAAGHLPLDSLTKFESLGAKHADKDGKISIAAKDVDDATIKEITAVFDAVIMQAVIEPVITEGHSTEKEIGVEDISFMDKMEIFSKCKGGNAESLATFRE